MLHSYKVLGNSTPSYIINAKTHSTTTLSKMIPSKDSGGDAS